MPELVLPLLAVLFVAVVFVPDLAPTSAGLGVQLASWIPLLVLALVAVRVARMRVRLTRSEIIQYGLFGARRIPIGEVERFIGRRQLYYPFGYPIVVLRSGAKIGLPLAGGVLLGLERSLARLHAYYPRVARAQRDRRAVPQRDRRAAGHRERRSG